MQPFEILREPIKSLESYEFGGLSRRRTDMENKNGRTVKSKGLRFPLSTEDPNFTDEKRSMTPFRANS